MEQLKMTIFAITQDLAIVLLKSAFIWGLYFIFIKDWLYLEGVTYVRLTILYIIMKVLTHEIFRPTVLNEVYIRERETK